MRAVVLSGGLTHDFPATTACLAELLDEAGLEVDVHSGRDGVDVRADGAARRRAAGRQRAALDDDGPRRAGPLPRAGCRRGRRARRRRPGRPSRPTWPGAAASSGCTPRALCFDDWPGWGETLGAAWVWGESFHPPLGPEITASPSVPHPLVDGIDPFSLVDEVYCGLDRQPGRPGSAARAPTRRRRPAAAPAVGAGAPRRTRRLRRAGTPSALVRGAGASRGRPPGDRMDDEGLTPWHGPWTGCRCWSPAADPGSARPWCTGWRGPGHGCRCPGGGRRRSRRSPPRRARAGWSGTSPRPRTGRR